MLTLLLVWGRLSDVVTVTDNKTKTLDFRTVSLYLHLYTLSIHQGGVPFKNNHLIIPCRLCEIIKRIKHTYLVVIYSSRLWVDYYELHHSSERHLSVLYITSPKQHTHTHTMRETYTRFPEEAKDQTCTLLACTHTETLRSVQVWSRIHESQWAAAVHLSSESCTDCTVSGEQDKWFCLSHHASTWPDWTSTAICLPTLTLLKAELFPILAG